MKRSRLGTVDMRGTENEARGRLRPRTPTAVGSGTVVLSDGGNLAAWSIDREKTSARTRL